MRLAIISDIHANLEALTQALEIIDGSSIDEIICLGDVVGYGADPDPCVNIIRERCNKNLIGNHDFAAIDLEITANFNVYARQAAFWTRENLTAENLKYLGDLPYTLEYEKAYMVHSSPHEPQNWHYIFSAADAVHHFDAFETAVCFVGHSHVPGVYCEDSSVTAFEKGNKYIINVGSVGQPRDNNPQLSFGVFDTEKWTYENIRSDYDIQTASEKIRTSGLPEMLAERLVYGR